MKDHLEYAYLGAVGPGIGDFLTPPFPDEPPYPEDYKTLWRRVFHVIGRTDPPGLYPILGELEELLDTIGEIADNEDCDALVDLRDSGFEARITEVTQQFGSAVGTLQAEALEIAGLIGTGLKPAVTTDDPTTPVPPPSEWAPRDFLHWKRTGQFVQRLLAVADEEGDARLRAYAFGYLVAYSAQACGAGHINSIVGGPPRTQWWRQRFVRNYVDAWVHGFYGQTPRPSFAGDTPAPTYDSGSWPNLCSANLQDRIALGKPAPDELMDLVARGRALPEFIPQSFAENWFEAVKRTFPSRAPGMNASALNEAYAFTWLVLWFRTSGSILGCDREIPLEPPGGCGDAPGELDPFVNGVPIDGNVPQPPAPEIDVDVDEAAKICGIILAIIGGLLVLGGSVVLGGAAIAGAVALLDCDSVVDLDWQEVRCLVYWERMYLHNALLGIHRLLTLAALDYPYARELAIDADYQDLFPFLDAWETGSKLTKSRVDIRYPGKPWDGSLLTFNRAPTEFESPSTIAYRDEAYPSFFIDDGVANPLANGEADTATPTAGAPDGGVYKRESGAAGQQPSRFGNAVANAVDLLHGALEELPDWNLDSDRGLAYLTWRFESVYQPDDVSIEPEPDA
jgi:hypothetical protein